MDFCIYAAFISRRDFVALLCKYKSRLRSEQTWAAFLPIEYHLIIDSIKYQNYTGLIRLSTLNVNVKCIVSGAEGGKW